MFTVCRHCTMSSVSISNFNLTTTLGNTYYFPQFIDKNAKHQRREETSSKVKQLVGGAAGTQIQVCLLDPRTQSPLSLSALPGSPGVATSCLVLSSTPTKPRIQWASTHPCSESELTPYRSLHSKRNALHNPCLERTTWGRMGKELTSPSNNANKL